MPETMNDHQRIRAAFQRLASNGFYTDEGTLCCRTCTDADLKQRAERDNVQFEQAEFVYYHQSGSERAFGQGEAVGLVDVLHLYWQTRNRSPRVIVDALADEGLRVKSPRSSSTSIMVLPPASTPHDFYEDRSATSGARCLICRRSKWDCEAARS